MSCSYGKKNLALHEELGKILYSVEESTSAVDLHQEEDVVATIAEDVAVENEDTRYDQIAHWIISTVSEHKYRQRCKKCGAHTYYYCDKCKKHLCFTSDRNCFKDYHHRDGEVVLHAAMDETIRYDQCGHWLLPQDGVHTYRQRCKVCGVHTNHFCEKCEVHLCLTLYRNCFRDYHNK